MNKSFLLFFILVTGTKITTAAPCCGGTANMPSIISGDDRTQISTTFTSSQIIAEAPVGGGIKYRKPNDSESAQTLRFDLATLISDRWQTGITIPVTRRSRERGTNSASASGLGDVCINVAYEAIPDWDYSIWRPKSLIFFGATLPTGGSIYDAKELYRIDSRGRGFYILSAGTLLSKSWGIWDTSLVLEAHHPFNRTLSNDLGELYLKPGWGSSGNLSLGASPWNGNVRLGLSLTSSYEAPISTEGVISGSGEKVNLWTPSVQVSYLADDNLSMSLIVSDQTLIKSSNNSALSRSVSLLVQRRWER